MVVSSASFPPALFPFLFSRKTPELAAVTRWLPMLLSITFWAPAVAAVVPVVPVTLGVSATAVFQAAGPGHGAAWR